MTTWAAGQVPGEPLEYRSAGVGRSSLRVVGNGQEDRPPMEMTSSKMNSNGAHKRRRALLPGLLALAWALCLLGCGAESGGGGYQAAPIPVMLTELKDEDFSESVELLGEVRSNSDAAIRSEVSGVISELLVDVGDSVKKDQVVAILDGSEQQLMAAEAEARLAEGRSRLDELQNAARPEVLAQREAEVRAARAREKEAEAQLSAARRLAPQLLAQREAEHQAALAAEKDAADQYRRTQGLVRQGAQAERELISVRTTWERARADLARAQQALSAQQTTNQRDELAAVSQLEAARAGTLNAVAMLEESQRGARREVVEAQRGVVAALAASRDRAALNYARTEVRSAVAGTVRERLLSRGDRVEAGTAVLNVSGGDVELYFEVPEGMLGKVKPGQTVLVTFPAGEKDQKAEVVGVSSAADPRTRRQSIRVAYKGEDALAGSSVRGTLLIPVEGDYLVMDRDALVQREGQWLVYSIDKENKAVEHQVTLVAERGQTVAVSGLKELGEGGKVVGRGSPGMSQGALVALPEAKEDKAES